MTFLNKDVVCHLIWKALILVGDRFHIWKVQNEYYITPTPGKAIWSLNHGALKSRRKVLPHVVREVCGDGVWMETWTPDTPGVFTRLDCKTKALPHLASKKWHLR